MYTRQTVRLIPKRCGLFVLDLLQPPTIPAPTAQTFVHLEELPPGEGPYFRQAGYAGSGRVRRPGSPGWFVLVLAGRLGTPPTSGKCKRDGCCHSQGDSVAVPRPQ
jgi:hypothetical protein